VRARRKDGKTNCHQRHGAAEPDVVVESRADRTL
jgi:hypothetical protein